MASRLIPSLLLVFLPACLFPQTPDKPVVSVLDFEASGLSQAEAQVFVDFIASHIVKTGAYRVIDRKQREALLEEIEFSYADCAEETCQIEIGRLLAASHIIVGRIGKWGNRTS